MDDCLKNLEYRFLVESTKIYIIPISYKTDHTKANVKTNKLWSILLLTYHEELCFTNNSLIFPKIKDEHKSVL